MVYLDEMFLAKSCVSDPARSGKTERANGIRSSLAKLRIPKPSIFQKFRLENECAFLKDRESPIGKLWQLLLSSAYSKMAMLYLSCATWSKCLLD